MEVLSYCFVIEIEVLFLILDLFEELIITNYKDLMASFRRNFAQLKMVVQGLFIPTKPQAKYCRTSEEEDLNADSFLLLQLFVTFCELNFVVEKNCFT
jgi:hypothetical protein